MIHPDDAQEAFGVLALHFGGATDGTAESLRLYRRLEAAWTTAMLALEAAWTTAMLALEAARERREKLA